MTTHTPEIAYLNGTLQIEDVSIPTIAASIGTPFYAYSAGHMRAQYEAFRGAFSDQWKKRMLVCYAMKANSNQAVVRFFSRLGAGSDIVTGGELHRALEAGVPANQIVFSGIGKTEEDIRAAIRARIRQINVESVAELRKINSIAASMNATVPIAFRLNPQLDTQSRDTEAKITTGKPDSKFGIPWKSVEAQIQLLGSVYNNVVLKGFSLHIGSNLKLDEFDQYERAFIDLRKRVEILITNDTLKTIDTLDLGGGVAITYGTDTGIQYADPVEPNKRFERYAQIVQRVFREFVDKNPNICFIFEPGRAMVGNAGVLVSKVINVKDETNTSKIPVTFLIIDAAMNDLARPSLYNSYHEIRPVRQPDDARGWLTQVDICGPACETTDSFCRNASGAFEVAKMAKRFSARRRAHLKKKLSGNQFGEEFPPSYSYSDHGKLKIKYGFFLRRKFPPQKEGDLVAIMSAGAYGAVMASEYNTRPLVPEVIVDGNKWEVIRKRPTIQEIVQRDIVPDWL